MSNVEVVAPVISRRQVLSSRNFRALWLSQAISTFGDKFTEIAIPILIYNITGSPIQLGFAFILQTVSAVIFGLIAGVLSDRWDRRHTMIGSDLIRAVMILALPIIVLMPLSLTVKLVLVYSLSFLMAAVKQFFLPAKIALIPETVTKEQLVAANSLDQATMTLMMFFGAGAAGAVIDWWGVQTAFFIDGGTFLLSAFFVALINLEKSRTSPPASTKRETLKDGILEGLGFVWQTPILKGTLLLSVLAPLAIGAMQPLLLLFARETIQAGNFGYGLLEASFGLGLSLGVMLIGKMASSMQRGRLLTGGVIGMGIGQIIAVALPLTMLRLPGVNSWWLLGVTFPFFVLGAAANGAVLLGLRTIVQENSPRHMIGRVFNVLNMLSSVAITLGASTAGLAKIWDAGLLLLMWGVFLTIVGLWASMWKSMQA
ncbi:MAG: MFS transporter [Chloroflexi bacterium]|nr:MAG: MFS transporter [Chloroflexota bacterium]